MTTPVEIQTKFINKINKLKVKEHKKIWANIHNNPNSLVLDRAERAEVTSLYYFFRDKLKLNTPILPEVIKRIEGKHGSDSDFVQWKNGYTSILNDVLKDENINPQGKYYKVISLAQYWLKNFTLTTQDKPLQIPSSNPNIIRYPTCEELQHIKILLLKQHEKNSINTDEVYDYFEQRNNNTKLSQEIRDEYDEKCF